MALVLYSDSEGSESETEVQAQPVATKNESSKLTQGFSSLVDRGNPRKIRVALPEIMEADGEDDGPARKKPRTNGGATFSGFNSILPAPKRNAQTMTASTSTGSGVRKVFSLKTGANPGFDRQADAEMRQDQALNESSTSGNDHDNDTIPKPGSLQDNGAKDSKLLREEDYKKKGNAMMFKPLSVARNKPKKSASIIAALKAPAADGVAQKIKETSAAISVEASTSGPSPSNDAPAAPAAPPKPKIRLFSFANEEVITTSSDTSQAPAQSSSTGYESLIYKPSESDVAAGPEIDSSILDQQHQPMVSSYTAASQQQAQTLDNIVNDLGLSRSQRRQLIGRNPQVANSRVVNFNADAEWAANQELLSKTSAEEIAAAQHNPVRTIAPGKHSLQQLVQVANSQRDALEESFASGRRNKKEAGSRYGW